MDKLKLKLKKSPKMESSSKELKPSQHSIHKSTFQMNVSYNPYENRSKSYQLNDFEAAMTLIKGTLGPGIIAMPYAFSLCGYMPAILTLLMYPIIFVYCTHLLINGMNSMCTMHRVPVLSYADAMRLALSSGPPILRNFSRSSVIFIDLLMVLYHFCAATIYVIIIACLIQDVIDDYIVSLDSRLLMVVLIIPLIPIFSIKTLKNMVSIWTLANILTMISIVLLFYYLLSDLPNIKLMAKHHSLMNYAESFGFFLFSLQSMGTLLPIEAKMKNPQRFLGWHGLVVIIHIVIVIICIVFGFFGYWRYGIDVEENIIMNIPDQQYAAQLIRVFWAAALYLSYPLQASVVITNVWFHWLAKNVVEQDKQPLEFVMRIIVVLFSAIFAVCLVNLTAVVPLTGSICITILGIVFPALLNICIRYRYGFGKLKWMLVKDIFLMILGIFAGLMGAAASIRVIFIEMRFF